MDVTFDFTKIKDYVLDKLEEGGLLQKVTRLKLEFDFNPFNDDEDQWEGPWEEMRHNVELVTDVAMSAIHICEAIVIDGQQLNDPQKRKVVVEVLDDVIRLPWYAEPFDGTAIGMVVDSMVATMNSIGWIRDIAGVGEIDAKEDEKVEIKGLLGPEVNPGKKRRLRTRKLKGEIPWDQRHA